MKQGIFAVDFDGTVVTNEFPKVGRDVGAQYVLKPLTDNGSKLLLFTCRGTTGTDWEDNPLGCNPIEDAIEWFKSNNIPLWAVNRSPDQDWTDSPKPFFHYSFDDRNFNAPFKELACSVKSCTTYSSAVYEGTIKVYDWQAVAQWLLENDYITLPQYTEASKQIFKVWENFKYKLI